MSLTNVSWPRKAGAASDDLALEPEPASGASGDSAPVRSVRCSHSAVMPTEPVRVDDRDLGLVVVGAERPEHVDQALAQAEVVVEADRLRVRCARTDPLSLPGPRQRDGDAVGGDQAEPRRCPAGGGSR